MKKKYQVFVSSTYTDLKEDRQVAVEAILKAGDIPAGMELFAADNESQLTVIKRWIDESDIFVLILGGRYGTIEPKSGKSYTQLEYEYAVNKKMPYFSIVMSDSCLDQRLKAYGKDVIETVNAELYHDFKKSVTDKVCTFYDDLKDIRIGISENLADFHRRYNLSGWISGNGFNVDDYLNETKELKHEIKRLTQENSKLKATARKTPEITHYKKNLFVSDDFDTRVQRLLNLLHFSKQGNPIDWVGDDGSDYSMNKVTDSFDPYFIIIDKNNENFDYIVFLYVDNGNTSINLQGLFSEIRLQLEEIPHANLDCRFKFVIASEKITDEIKNACMKSFIHLLAKSSLTPELRTKIEFEIWNINTVKEIEIEYGLYFDDLQFDVDR